MSEDNTLADELQEAAARGMSIAVHAAHRPLQSAVKSNFGERNWSQLNAAANQLARLLRKRHVGHGHGIALLCRNRPQFIETYAANLRAGTRLTPINWHLNANEVSYIVNDCDAKVMIADATCPEVAAAVRKTCPQVELFLSIGGELEGYEDFDRAIEAESTADLEAAQLGISMLYTSGTTGHPKGVYRKASTQPPPFVVKVRESGALDPASHVSLVTGPLYHAAPFGLNMAVPLGAGVGQVLMDGWDAEETLALIDRERVSHSHLVATMFHRLLQLPQSIKDRYNLDSLRWIIHGAAPTPVHIKRSMIEWWGPILWEYYAATEGGSYYLDSHEWLKKPGSVGRPVEGTVAKVLDAEANEVGPEESGTVYFLAPDEGRFTYYKAPEKTACAYQGDYFTMGDIGHLDADGYLFLTGRSAETIISGGVNIYPQEIDDVLQQHPAVYEVCTIGIPSDEWGESVKSVVELNPEWEAQTNVADQLLAFCGENLPAYKRPRSIDFEVGLPRMPTGKIQRHKVRAKYWQGRDRQI